MGAAHPFQAELSLHKAVLNSYCRKQRSQMWKKIKWALWYVIDFSSSVLRGVSMTVLCFTFVPFAFEKKCFTRNFFDHNKEEIPEFVFVRLFSKAYKMCLQFWFQFFIKLNFQWCQLIHFYLKVFDFLLHPVSYLIFVTFFKWMCICFFFDWFENERSQHKSEKNVNLVQQFLSSSNWCCSSLFNLCKRMKRKPNFFFTSQSNSPAYQWTFAKYICCIF